MKSWAIFSKNTLKTFDKHSNRQQFLLYKTFQNYDKDFPSSSVLVSDTKLAEAWMVLAPSLKCVPIAHMSL